MLTMFNNMTWIWQVRVMLNDIKTLESACHTASKRLADLPRGSAPRPEEQILVGHINEIEKEKFILQSNLPTLIRYCSVNTYVFLLFVYRGCIHFHSWLLQTVLFNGAMWLHTALRRGRGMDLKHKVAQRAMENPTPVVPFINPWKVYFVQDIPL